jgi:hypothetical protein
MSEKLGRKKEHAPGEVGRGRTCPREKERNRKEEREPMGREGGNRMKLGQEGGTEMKDTIRKSQEGGDRKEEAGRRG